MSYVILAGQKYIFNPTTMLWEGPDVLLKMLNLMAVQRLISYHPSMGEPELIIINHVIEQLRPSEYSINRTKFTISDNSVVY